MIPLIVEPKELQQNTRIYEDCVFCGNPTNTWHNLTNNPVCTGCSRTHKVSELKKSHPQYNPIKIKMTQKQIDNGNKILSEYMGGREVDWFAERVIIMPYSNINVGELTIHNYHSHCKAYVLNTEIKYYSSWDWLMLVIEKINSTQQMKGATRDLQYTISYLLGGGYRFSDSEREKLVFSRENLWDRAVQYRKWHIKKGNETLKKLRNK